MDNNTRQVPLTVHQLNILRVQLDDKLEDLRERLTKAEQEVTDLHLKINDLRLTRNALSLTDPKPEVKAAIQPAPATKLPFKVAQNDTLLGRILNLLTQYGTATCLQLTDSIYRHDHPNSKDAINNSEEWAKLNSAVSVTLVTYVRKKSRHGWRLRRVKDPRLKVFVYSIRNTGKSF